MKLLFLIAIFCCLLHGVSAMPRRRKVFNGILASVFRRKSAADTTNVPISSKPSRIVAIEPSEPEEVKWTVSATTCFPYVPQNLPYQEFVLLEPKTLKQKKPLLLHHSLQTDKNVEVPLEYKDITAAFGVQEKWKAPIVYFFLELTPVSRDRCLYARVELSRQCYSASYQPFGTPYVVSSAPGITSSGVVLAGIDNFKPTDAIDYCTYSVGINGGSKKCQYTIDSGRMKYRGRTQPRLKPAEISKPVAAVKRKPWRNPHSIFRWTTREASTFPYVDIEAQFDVFTMKKEKMTLSRHSPPLRLHEYNNVELDIEVDDEPFPGQMRWTSPLSFVLKLKFEIRQGTDCSDARVELIGKSPRGRQDEVLGQVTGEENSSLELKYSETRGELNSDYVYDLKFSQPPEPRVVKEFADDSSYDSPDQLKPCLFDLKFASKSYFHTY